MGDNITAGIMMMNPVGLSIESILALHQRQRAAMAAIGMSGHFGVTHHHQEQDGVVPVVALQHAGAVAGLLAWANIATELTEIARVILQLPVKVSFETKHLGSSTLAQAVQRCLVESVLATVSLTWGH